MPQKLPKAFPERSSFKNLKEFQANPISFFTKVSAFGTPVALNLPMGKFVQISDPEQVYHVLTTNADNYQKSKGYKEIARVLGQGLVTAEGEEWKKQRKLLQPAFHKVELRKLLPSTWETIQSFMQAWKSGDSIHLDMDMSKLTLSILLNTLIHYPDADLNEKLSNHVLFGQEFVMKRIRSPFKPPMWLPTSDNRKYHQMMSEIEDIVRKCITHRQSLQGEHVRDLLAILLENYDAAAEFVKIQDELMTFLVAGHETSALGLTWTLLLLARNPEAQEKMYQEVKDLSDLESMDMMNFKNLSYTQQVIKESMRIYPPVWNIVRLAKGDDTINGFRIPADHQLMLNIYLLHHNPSYWPAPEAFRPERFAQDAPPHTHKYQYLPFGGGNRFCIGNNFAMNEMVLALTQFVRKFQFSDPSPEVEYGFNPLLTLRPDRPIHVKIEARN